MQVELAKEQESHTSTVTYRKVTSRRLVAHPRIYRLFMKGKFNNAYLLRPLKVQLDKKVQN